jgi:transcription-repair coupling factor (superfamily II helicase)
MTAQPSTQSNTTPHPQTNSGAALLDLLSQQDWVRAAAFRYLQAEVAVETHLDNLANPSVKALLVAATFKLLKQPVVVICPDAHAAQKYQFELHQVLSPDDIALYPPEEFNPYELSILPIHALRQQIEVLRGLEAGTPQITLIPSNSLLFRHRSLAGLDADAIQLSVNQTLSPEDLTAHCQALGYLRTSLIVEPGEFSSRGDIFDIYPINGVPLRIEFFGDTLESIRLVDITNQRSIGTTDAAQILPRNGIVLTPDNRALLTQALGERLVAQKGKLNQIEFEGLETTLLNQLQALEQHANGLQDFIPDGIDYYGPLVHHDYVTLPEIIPPNAVVVFDDWNTLTNHLQGLSDRLSHVHDDGIARGRLLDLDFSFHVTDTEALKTLKERCHHRLFLDTLPLNADGTVQISEASAGLNYHSVDVQAPERFKADLRAAVEYLKPFRRDGYRLFITTDNPQRVLDACKEWDIAAHYWTESGMSQDDASWLGNEVIVSKQGVSEGFVLPSAKLVHLTDTELYGRRLKRVLIDEKARGKRRDDMDVINSIDELRTGDYVVHYKHGIGQFIELRTIKLDGERREYLCLQYSGSDTLFVPVDQVHLLSRYRGAGDVKPKLNKMGGMEWTKVKSKVQKSIQTIAKELVDLYAARAKAVGHAFDHDSPWQIEMEEAFPYTETPDQWEAIQASKRDMESDKPMDRLVCGDVGFGKTEVALRVIFKAVLSGKQVAFLVPTTVLAQQHFNTLTERFQAYPVRLGLISRFRSPKEQKEILARLAIGECDVLVGTHRLLQKDVRFKDLGLVVIDEEHRFGVAHKEKLKHLRNNVDVLTLSATPIPRTLYMAISGVREMSLIKTPPTNRSPVKTFVGPYNPAQIRMAILQEIDRGGQAYFVHNRVQSIHQVAAHLADLVPEARVVIAHGQMAEHELETAMLDFAQRQYDILLCTTIIESGLDLPNVNTMIVDRADRFGLAQLYQIRGRVGRSNVQAYCYCYYDPDKQLTQDAQDRLRCIREFTALGSGYQVAMRDMEIRGVGNILGETQHGHMIAVGFDMYCQMLEQGIEELKDGKVIEEKESSIIDLNVTALIPEDWVGDRNVKLTEYKRLASLDSEVALDIIQAEWRDRFGDIPEARPNARQTRATAPMGHRPGHSAGACRRREHPRHRPLLATRMDQAPSQTAA